MDYLQRSPVKLTIGAVNISDGEMFYADPTTPNFIDYVLASTAIPIMMPYLNIGGSATQCYFDGGIRDIAPLKKAIESGAEEIVCVSCHPKNISSSSADFKNLMSLATRVMEIIENETISADIEWAETCNEFLVEDAPPIADGPLKGYKKFKLTVIRPDQQINLDLENFKAEEIRAIMDNGEQTAKEILE
jgi:NTE family protein